MTLRRALFHALGELRDRSPGALVRRLPDGSQAGAILAAQGRICWATCAEPGEPSDPEQAAPAHAIPRERLDDAVRRSRESEAQQGQEAVHGGEDALRHELLREACESIRALLAHDGSWEWSRNDGLAYSPALTFGAAEVSAGLSALEDPTLVQRAQQRLAAVLSRDQHGFTLDEGEIMPLAHIGCGPLGHGALLDQTRQAQELMTLGQTALATGLIAVIEGASSAIWREENLLHVVIDTSGNAVNRLVAQLAAATAAS